MGGGFKVKEECGLLRWTYIFLTVIFIFNNKRNALVAFISARNKTFGVEHFISYRIWSVQFLSALLLLCRQNLCFLVPIHVLKLYLWLKKPPRIPNCMLPVFQRMLKYLKQWRHIISQNTIYNHQAVWKLTWKLCDQ